MNKKLEEEGWTYTGITTPVEPKIARSNDNWVEELKAYQEENNIPKPQEVLMEMDIDANDAFLKIWIREWVKGE